MLFPQVDILEWIELHRIELQTQCHYCETEKIPLIPFATKDSRGILYECKCREHPPSASFVSSDPKERQKLKNLFQALKPCLDTLNDPQIP